MTKPQPQPPASPLGALSGAFRTLLRQGLTVDDIGRLFGIHPKAIATMLSDSDTPQMDPFTQRQTTNESSSY